VRLRLAFAVLLVHCSPQASTDGGVDVIPDAPLACQLDAAAAPDAALNPTHPAHQNACTAAQAQDYAQCQSKLNTDLCVQFKPSGTSAACGACIETPADAPDGGPGTWGVIVFNGPTAFMNVEGCVDVALGQTTNQNPPSCGQLLHNLYTCEAITCSGCSGSDFNTCELVSIQDFGVCKANDDAVSSTTGPCGVLASDVWPPDVTNCFPDTSITDTTQQQVDWLKRIVTFMCGP
jgi:hypothetical protein